MVDCQFKTVTLKTDITDNFPIAIALRTDEPVHQSQKVQNVHKLTAMKKQRLREIDWVKIKKWRIPMKHINIFLKHLF